MTLYLCHRIQIKLETSNQPIAVHISILQHNIRFLQEILQNRKSDFLEWLIIALIGAEILLSLYDIVHRSALASLQQLRVGDVMIEAQLAVCFTLNFSVDLWQIILIWYLVNRKILQYRFCMLYSATPVYELQLLDLIFFSKKIWTVNCHKQQKCTYIIIYMQALEQGGFLSYITQNGLLINFRNRDAVYTFFLNNNNNQQFSVNFF